MAGLPIQLDAAELAFDDEEGEIEDEAGKKAKKKFKKGRQAVPPTGEIGPRRKPKPSGRRRDWDEDWDEGF